MRLSNIKIEDGEGARSVPVEKWIFILEIDRCPPSMFRRGVFKPYFFFVFAKFKDRPLFYVGEGNIHEGVVWNWTSPFGIRISIDLV